MAADPPDAASAAHPLAVTVVIPTIGRVALLRRCLESIAATNPPPSEVLVVDQSGTDEARLLVQELTTLPARVVPCEGRGIPRGVNLGLREAAHELVLVTHDDCTVEPDWVAAGVRQLADLPGGIVSGQVRPAGDPDHVPSTKVDPQPHDYAGELVINGVYGNNLALHRAAVLEIGGFDEREGFQKASEDNDLCFRWLRDGRPLRYAPDSVVWHHDWRTEDELVRHYRTYARSDGVLFAKHVLRRDWAILPFLFRAIDMGARGTVGGIVRRRPAWKDPRRAILRHLPVGFALGVREELRLRRTARRRHAT